MNRLKELRIKKKLSRNEIAKQLNIKPRTYTSYENNEREPNSETLIALASFFSVSIDYLICRTDTNEFLSNSSAQPINDAFLLYNQLDNEDKAEIRGEIKQMLKAPKYTASESQKIIQIDNDYEIAAWGAKGTKGTYKKPTKEIT